VTIARVPRLLIPDTTPLSLLSMMGQAALDWLFELGAEVWVTDMVREEAMREPEPGADRRMGQRKALRDWFATNANRIRIQPTPQGADYQREMRNWVGAGRVAADKPSWRNRGEASIADLVPLAAEIVQFGEALVFLVDDRAARAVLVAAAQINAIDADIMGTQSFLAMLEQDFHVIEAGTAWQAIRIAADGDVPVPYDPDPIIVRPATS
jgi:hypothetical protein